MSSSSGFAGASYLDIAAAGGGIVSTVRADPGGHRGDLLARAARVSRGDARSRRHHGGVQERLRARAATPSSGCSGSIVELASDSRQRLVPTFSAAHVVPPEYRDRRAGYVDLWSIR